MLKYLKISASALALAALVGAPATTIITADYAYAKSENAGGKGGDKGGDRGGKGGNSGKGAEKSSKAGGQKSSKGGNGNKGGGFKSATRGFKNDMKAFGKAFKNDVGGLFGKKNKTQKTTAKAAAPATAKAKVAKADPMHPSNLGKMNGFLNSSPNAKLAHIANGQYLNGSGPVSLAAALAVAGYQLELTEDAVATLAQSEAINDALTTLTGLTPEDIAAAQDIVDVGVIEGVSAEDVAAAQAIVDGGVIEGVTTQADVDAAQATVEAGVIEGVSEEDVAAAQDILDAQETLNTAAADGAFDPETGMTTAEFDADVADAEAVVADVPEGVDPLEAAQMSLDEAEANALSTYKDQAYLEGLTDEERSQFLEDAVAQYGALPDDTAIADALETYNARSAEEELDPDLDEDTSASADDELLEEETSEG